MIAVGLLASAHNVLASDTAGSAAHASQNAQALQLAALSRSPATTTPAAQQQERSPWINAAGLNDNARFMLGTIANANDFGVESERLHIDEISELLGLQKQSMASTLATTPERLENLAPGSLAKLDTLLTSAFKLLVGDVLNGRVSARETQRYWFAEPEQANVEDWMQMLQHRPDSLPQILSNLVDETRAIQPMLQQLAVYQGIADAGGWPSIPEGPTIEPEEDSMRVSVMRTRLSVTGDYDPGQDYSSSTIYSYQLQEAVKSFQARHGLLTDGLVGKATLAAMNMPVEKRIDQIKVNLERQRWLPKSFGDRHLVTNIPDFQLRVVEYGQTTLQMPVVVGKPKHMTPVFSAEMDHLVVNPTWTVPRSITNKELVPSERSNPGYLQRKNFQVLASNGSPISYDSISPDAWHSEKFPYTLRQRPGKRNALGKVKFMFPNKHSIYLHDTPAKKLFAKQRRAYSHGCVRVGEPRELANHLLQQEGWNPDDIETLFQKTRTKRIDLKEPLTNHIIYLTSWVDDEGVLQFRNDVYAQDKRVAKALGQEETQRMALMKEFRSLQPVVIAEQWD